MIRVFVGCAANGEDVESQAVLENSLRRHTDHEVEITWMHLSQDPKSPFSKWRTDLWSTPFSGFRWIVPELCDFKGRALYMDSDVIIRADISLLWETVFEPNKVVVAKGGPHGWRFCVSLWNCERAKRYLPAMHLLKSTITGHRNMIDFMRVNQHLVQPFSNGNWNCIDGEDYLSVNDPDIKILHYSSEAHQPHLRYAVPRLAKQGRRHWFDGEIKHHWHPPIEAMFDQELMFAIDAGYTPDKYVPSVMYGEYVKKSEKNYKSHQYAR